MDPRIEALSRETHDRAVAVIIEGLTEHWGTYDNSFNSDLDDLFAAYGDGVTLVVLIDQDVVGTGTLMRRDTDIAEIVRMSVSSSVRRSGIGRQLVEALIEIAADWGCTEVTLETTSTWVNAVGLYLACGFEITHTDVGRFGPGTYFRRDVAP